MVADSAVTTDTGIGLKVTNHANKLQFISYLSAAISMWGMGDMPKSKVSTDKWVEGFINRNSDLKSLQLFASKLATELQEEVGDIKEQ